MTFTHIAKVLQVKRIRKLHFRISFMSNTLLFTKSTISASFKHVGGNRLIKYVVLNRTERHSYLLSIFMSFSWFRISHLISDGNLQLCDTMDSHVERKRVGLISVSSVSLWKTSGWVLLNFGLLSVSQFNQMVMKIKMADEWFLRIKWQQNQKYVISEYWSISTVIFGIRGECRFTLGGKRPCPYRCSEASIFVFARHHVKMSN